MNVIIIEDEKLNYNELCRILTDIDQQIVVSPQLSTISEVRSYMLNHYDFDLIFADIRLSDGIVFEALADIDNNKPIIFTTAYDEYSIRAFEYNGIAYLLKPIQKDEVEKSLKSFVRRQSISPSFSQILTSIKQRDNLYRQHFLVHHANYSEVVSVEQISHISTESNITRLFLTEGRSVIIKYTLDELCSQLNPKDFFRANRQYIVHIKHVQRLHNWFSGKTRLQIDCYPEIRIEISKERTSKLKLWLDS